MAPLKSSFVCGPWQSIRVRSQRILVSGDITPCCKAVMACAILKIEPGRYCAISGRLNNGLLVSLLISLKLELYFLPVKRLGSYEGPETSARISPDEGSIAAMLPDFPDIKYSPYCWRSRSIPVIRSW